MLTSPGLLKLIGREVKSLILDPETGVCGSSQNRSLPAWPRLPALLPWLLGLQRMECQGELAAAGQSHCCSAGKTKMLTTQRSLTTQRTDSLRPHWHILPSQLLSLWCTEEFGYKRPGLFLSLSSFPPFFPYSGFKMCLYP